MAHKIKVPVTWEMRGFVEIEVENASEIEKVFNKIEYEGEGFDLPMESDYMEDSFRLDLNMEDLDEGILDEMYGIGYNATLKITFADGGGNLTLKTIYDINNKVILDVEPHNSEFFKCETITLIYEDEVIQDFTFVNETLANRFK